MGVDADLEVVEWRRRTGSFCFGTSVLQWVSRGSIKVVQGDERPLECVIDSLKTQKGGTKII